ncbi:MAG: NAD(P)H-dependent oxidoreductase [Clostridia bacterium]|nr:NAD(P)H-dependent oxidoreductase [Clostridia bacterium]
MKKLFCLLTAALMLLCAMPGLSEETPAHVLVVYFSRAGENYSVGVIDEGNTAKMGTIIADQLNADAFELVPAVPYPEDYDSCLDVATEEKRTGARPAYVGEIENFAQYDTVFIGYPIWWGGIPNIVCTFMETYDFTGKTVVPFNTHEGSGQAGSQSVIAELMTGATILQGLAVRGSRAQSDPDGTASDVAAWLHSIGLTD